MKGVLLMAYGTPRGVDEVEAFYTDIRGGRPPTPELLANLRGRYEAVGGRTPLLEISRQQASGLEAALGPELRVFAGMKHWHPYIGEAVAQMEAASIGEAVAMALAPHYSALSVGAYMQAIEATGTSIAFRQVRSWHLQPAYLEAVANNVRAASEGFDPEVVVFTAHSLPKRILDTGDPYVDQLQETSQAIASQLSLARWVFSFQSAGATGDAWLGPDILETVDRLADEGIRRLLVAPIGFISDHLEILYDLDVQARQRAASRGLDLRRTQSLNASSGLIEALKATVLEALS
ncbi:MAG TPA: ferrochelatase [Chloroflexota bacterium]|nr:ferrochelatase [Chloroflexota bacterium]